MAKEQGLSLNPTKISGTCGRLMCCLKYEQAAYEDLIRTTPRQGALVATPDGPGVVTEVSLLTGMLKVRLEKNQDGGVTVFDKKDVTVLRDGRAKGEAKGEDKGDKPRESKPLQEVPREPSEEGEDRGQARKGSKDQGKTEGPKGGRSRREGRRGPRGEGKKPLTTDQPGAGPEPAGEPEEGSG